MLDAVVQFGGIFEYLPNTFGNARKSVLEPLVCILALHEGCVCHLPDEYGFDPARKLLVSSSISFGV